MRHDEILGFLHSLLAPGQDATALWAGYWELAFWAFVLIVTALLMLVRPSWLSRVEAAFTQLSRHRIACIWSIAAAVVIVRTMLLPLVPIPVPVVLDEFSYLLGADTFAMGRLTNPPHPMWVHFEGFNINMLPSYQSMYPPAQAMALAFGQKLTGQPWVGVLLSVAVMCAAFCWMLQGWMPPQWALLGGIFAVFRYGIFSYWINSYWGGAVAAIGGALLVGTLPRLRRQLTLRNSALFVLGLVILANSRPFEGLLFSLPFLCAFAWLVFSSPVSGRQRLTRALLPCVLILGVAAGWMLYYNWRGTNNPLRMPYSVNQATYHISKPFLFQKPWPIPHYNHPEMRAFYVFHELPDILRARSRWGVEQLLEEKLFCCYTFLVWPFALLFVPGMLIAARSPGLCVTPRAMLRVISLAILLMTAGLAMQIWPAHGHYAAPAAGAILLVVLNALYCLNSANSSPRYWFKRAVVLSIFLWMLVPIAERLWNPYSFDNFVAGDRKDIPKEIDLLRIQSQIGRLPGQHLILVHYRMRDIPSQDWINNRADIDNAKIVWARDMGPIANQELLRYFSNRSVWYVDRNGGSIITPYATYLALTHPDQTLLTDHRRNQF